MGRLRDMNEARRRDHGLSRVARITRWSAAGAIAATAAVSGLVAAAQPGRASASSNTTSSDQGTGEDGTNPSSTTAPSTTAPSSTPHKRSTTTVPVPAPAPRRHRTQTTSGGS